MSVYDVGRHAADCMMRRYCQLPSDTREYWPEAFSSRPQLCTCGLVPDAEAVQPDYAEDRRELEEWLDRHTPS
jgi:hypothetical protein